MSFSKTKTVAADVVVEKLRLLSLRSNISADSSGAGSTEVAVEEQMCAVEAAAVALEGHRRDTAALCRLAVHSVGEFLKISSLPRSALFAVLGCVDCEDSEAGAGSFCDDSDADHACAPDAGVVTDSHGAGSTSLLTVVTVLRGRHAGRCELCSVKNSL
jgi:hypothetical protein